MDQYDAGYKDIDVDRIGVRRASGSRVGASPHVRSRKSMKSPGASRASQMRSPGGGAAIRPSLYRTANTRTLKTQANLLSKQGEEMVDGTVVEGRLVDDETDEQERQYPQQKLRKVDEFDYSDNESPDEPVWSRDPCVCVSATLAVSLLLTLTITTTILGFGLKRVEW